jgi:hypothetical protein
VVRVQQVHHYRGAAPAFYPASTRATTTPFPILPTYLGKSGRGGKSYRNRWQRTDRSPQVTNLFARDCRGSTLSTYIFLAFLHHRHRGPHPYLFFIVDIALTINSLQNVFCFGFMVFLFFLFKKTRSTSLHCDRPPHRGKT